MFNLVLYSILEDKKIYLNSKNRRFYREDYIFIKFIRINNYYLLKNNTTSNNFIITLFAFTIVKLEDISE